MSTPVLVGCFVVGAILVGATAYAVAAPHPAGPGAPRPSRASVAATRAVTTARGRL